MININDLHIGDCISSPQYTTITQANIQKFADATGDHQWIHIDAQKCVDSSPYGTTIAHGFFILSLMPKMFAESITIDPKTTTLINYGLDNLRFIEAVRVNDAIKYNFTLADIEEKPSGKLYKFEGTVVIENRDKPALIANFLSLVI